MAAPYNSERELRPEELKAIITELGVSNPVMSYRIVGSRIELNLLGGAVVRGKIDNEDLSNLSKKDLYALAKGLGISGRTKMSRKELEEAILSYSN